MAVEGPVGRSTCAGFFLLPSDACCWALDTLGITFVRDAVASSERVAILVLTRLVDEPAGEEAAIARKALEVGQRVERETADNSNAEGTGS